MGRFAVAAALGMLLPYLALVPLVSAGPFQLGQYLHFGRIAMLAIAWIGLMIAFVVTNEETNTADAES